MAKNSLSLAGPWLLRPDPEGRGVEEHWERFFAWYDDHSSMHIPGAWQKVLGPEYHGVAWLARVARLPESWRTSPNADQRIRLRFDSVATDATVFVNGVEVGRHVGDFIPFELDITDAVNLGWSGRAPMNPGFRGEVNIAVRVDEIKAPRPPAGQTTELGHITKGFHDVLSLQHGGIWGDVTVRRTGRRWIVPDGIRVVTDPERRSVRIRVELAGSGQNESLTFHIRDPAGEPILGGSDTLNSAIWERTVAIGARGDAVIWSGDESSRVNMGAAVPDPAVAERLAETVPIAPWSPDAPSLYTLVLDVVTGERPNEVVESHTIRFGFRTVTTGGPDNSQILLNGKPLLLRGVLHWGHEPDHIAPAPTPEQVRAEFAKLKELGFNCVCLCMWYPPRHYYDIADEMGMLLWQEHPVWKSPMEEELIPEYQRLFGAFFRRDRNHPSVVIVSGSCEHERIHPVLAEWWWTRAKEESEGRLCQIQTAFLGWTNPNQTDLHDEHVYDSSGRWARFCEDIQSALAELPPKPFVMGETIIGTSWLDTAAVSSAIGSASPVSTVAGQRADAQSAVRDPQSPARPWWTPKVLDECAAFERAIAARYGPETLERFRNSADPLNLLQRKFQSELLRMVPRHAGWVMNQIRDVPAGRLGFMDDLGRWRFTPEQMRPWLSDQVLLLRTPDQRRGFSGGQSIPVTLGLSNFGRDAFDGPVELRTEWNGESRTLRAAPIAAEPGQIAWSGSVSLTLPGVERPTRVRLRARAPGIAPNAWDLWAFPAVGDAPDGTVRLDGLPFSRADHEPEFEERCYSSGWGLRIRSWRQVLPFPETVLFKCPPWRFDAPLPKGGVRLDDEGRPTANAIDTRIIVTHKLTRSVLDFLTRGGRVLLLANKSPGGLGTKHVSLWGQVPLIIESPKAETPLRPGDSAWIAELLHHDLARRYIRTIPTDALKITDQVDPIVRLVHTHDGGAPRPSDQVFAARIGNSGGVLLATCLDHLDEPGRYLLQVFLEWLAGDDEPPAPRAVLDPGLVRSWALPL